MEIEASDLGLRATTRAVEGEQPVEDDGGAAAAFPWLWPPPLCTNSGSSKQADSSSLWRFVVGIFQVASLMQQLRLQTSESDS